MHHSKDTIAIEPVLVVEQPQRRLKKQEICHWKKFPCWNWKRWMSVTSKMNPIIDNCTLNLKLLINVFESKRMLLCGTDKYPVTNVVRTGTEVE